METSKEKQIEEMAKVLAFEIAWDEDEIPTVNCLETAKRLYRKGYRKQSEGELRVETTTDDFRDTVIAKERGYYRKRFYCPNCDSLIKVETWDSKRMFGSGTVLKSNEMPKFCPNCGAKMKGGTE